MVVNAVHKMWMQEKGYKELRPNAVELYGLIGEKLYNRILSSALDYSIMAFVYRGLDRSGKEFQDFVKKHTDVLVDEGLYFFNTIEPDDYCDAIRMFEQGDLEYIMSMIEQDNKKQRKLLKPAK